MVVTVEPGRQTLVISHDEIPGYMPAMVMPFHIKNENEPGGLQPGTRVNLQLVVGRKNSFVKKVRVQQRSTDKLKILPPTPSENMAIGTPVPDFQLTDQLRRSVKLSDFQGRVTVSFLQAAELDPAAPALASNRWETGVKTLQKASVMERALRYSEPPDYPRPVLEVLGRAALRQGQLAQAETAFREALVQFPGNSHANAGLRETLQRANKPIEAGF